MLEIIVLAATLYICPGNEYTDNPRTGCRPVQDSGNEGFSVIPEAPEFKSRRPPASTVDVHKPRVEGESELPAASAEECAMYDEWVRLSTKSSSLGARDLSTEEYERWTNLKQVFGNSPPPNCR